MLTKLQVIGLDCATEPKNMGISLGRFAEGRMQVLEVHSGKRFKAIAEMAKWLAATLQQPVLLAIDAPLGWPLPLAETLQTHRAGEPVPVEKNRLFRRQTDFFVKQHTGQLPLDVGADRIARAMHAALETVEELRQRTGSKFPLLLNSGLPTGNGMLEVYPAATLSVYQVPRKGYKGKNGKPVRQAMLQHLQQHLDFQLPAAQWHGLQHSDEDHLLDSVVCLLAARDFLLGQVYEPEDPALAAREGWIWVKKM